MVDIEQNFRERGRAEPTHALRIRLLAGMAVGLLPISAANAASPVSVQPGLVPATQPSTSEPSSVDEVVVTGTRQTGVKARESATPVQVIPAAQLDRTGQIDLRDALVQLAPSISRQVYTGATGGLTDVLSLHGLTPNDVLVLVNGKRRHTTSNLLFNGAPDEGATGVDVDLIPSSAIDHIEVLTDGDSAQYGTDAIAGVVNIILKSDVDSASLSSLVGQYYAGDGFTRDVSGQLGRKIGDAGFIDLSAQYAGHDHTNRSAVDPRTDKFDVKALGDPAINREVVSFSAGYDVSPNVEPYAFGSYGHREGDTYAFYRLPSTLPQIYPNGFSPRETLSENDYSITAGVKGATFLSGGTWDLSTTYGGDFDDFGMIDSANTSLYAGTGSTPTKFHLYNVSSTQWTNNLDVVTPFRLPVLQSPSTFSVGLEQREETYSIGAGDAASTYGSGSQALPGLQPQAASSHSRDVIGAYADLASNLTAQWKVGLSGRLEHYSDFGDTEIGKISTRYDFSPSFAVRASVGSGFQAPSLAEEYFNNIALSIISATGILPANSAAARTLGASPLKPENSTNYSVGFVARPVDRLNITLDLYQVDVRNRIVSGGSANGAAAINALTLLGYTLPSGISPASVSTTYFTNGADTRTRGLDLTANYLTPLAPPYGAIRWNLSANINDTALTRVSLNGLGKPSLNLQQQTWLTSSTPKYKLVAGADWNVGAWELVVSENIYGPTHDELTYLAGPSAFSVTNFYSFHNSLKYTTDILVSYRFTHALTWTVGARNVFNVYPDKVPVQNQYLGNQYDYTSSQLGIDGGYYYTTIRYQF